MGRATTKLLALIENRAMHPMEKISQQKHLLAVRKAMMAAFPLTMMASLFLFVTVVPLPSSWWLKQFLVRHEQVILAPYQMVVFITTIYVVLEIGSNLAASYHYDPQAGSFLAVISFLMTVVPVNASSQVPPDFLQQAEQLGLDTSWLDKLGALGWVLPETPLGESGILTAILSAIFGVEVLRLYKKFHAKRKSKPNKNPVIPDSIGRTLENLTPIAIVIFSLFILRDILGFSLQGITMGFMGFAVRFATTLPGAILVVLLVTLLWIFGIRGLAVASTTAAPVWAKLLSENLAAHNQGQLPPNLVPLPFYQWFVWIGGSGATLGLVIILCFSKSKYLRRLGYSSLLPSLVNINEPVLYGAPLILNPYLSIPFMLAPTVSALVAYFAMWMHWVTPPFSAPPLNTPAPVGAFLSTGDFRAVLLCLVNLALSAAIYYPFAKLYESKLLKDEQLHQDLGLKKEAPPVVTHVE